MCIRIFEVQPLVSILFSFQEFSTPIIHFSSSKLSPTDTCHTQIMASTLLTKPIQSHSIHYYLSTVKTDRPGNKTAKFFFCADSVTQTQQHPNCLITQTINWATDLTAIIIVYLQPWVLQDKRAMLGMQHVQFPGREMKLGCKVDGERSVVCCMRVLSATKQLGMPIIWTKQNT